MVGEHLFSVSKVRVEEAPRMGQTRRTEGDPGPPPPARFINELPEHYADRSRSGLRATVVKGVNREPDFEYRLIHGKT